jgi:hypothetical protein
MILLTIMNRSGVASIVDQPFCGPDDIENSASLGGEDEDSSSEGMNSLII